MPNGDDSGEVSESFLEATPNVDESTPVAPPPPYSLSPMSGSGQTRSTSSRPSTPVVILKRQHQRRLMCVTVHVLKQESLLEGHPSLLAIVHCLLPIFVLERSLKTVHCSLLPHLFSRRRHRIQKTSTLKAIPRQAA
jgi:hypothetical protein